MTELQRLHDTDCTLLMGVLNITEDSFSDGGLWLDPGKARDHGDDMLHAGADIIDIGAESTRPGAKRVSEKDELDRVTGAAKALIAHGAVVSIDTTRSAVAQAALDEGSLRQKEKALCDHGISVRLADAQDVKRLLVSYYLHDADPESLEDVDGERVVFHG